MMCGILGSYPIAHTQKISKGLEILAHRGPDDSRLAVTRRSALGHNRLAIQDVEGGVQPMAHDRHLLVFNGEIYNFQTLRSNLGGRFKTESDTEVILRLYAEQGPEAVEMLDGMYALALSDDDDLFLARDPLGIKPLYIARFEDRLYFASELKALTWFTDDIREFPPGHWWHSRYGLHRYFHLDDLEHASMPTSADREIAHQRIYAALQEAVHKRLIADDEVPVGVSLSGGLDSSIVAALARRGRQHLDTFAVGTDTSQDLGAAQSVADHLDTQHHILRYDLEDMLQALPEVIYHLESFDAALVRSAIPNYFLSRLASDHVKVILTGEGADELFGGYDYLEHIQDPDTFHGELVAITSRLHNTNLQRADRMSMAHGIEGRVPFLDADVLELAFELPAEWKMRIEGQTEKQLLRRSFADELPAQVVHRPKQKFSDGAGSMEFLAEHANLEISDQQFLRERQITDGVTLRSKEELHYYRIFKQMYGSSIDPGIVGRTRSVTPDELN
jgi:asparagine synthase (glutamine-hydrolysing)